ncbi:hypothetical protein GCM10025868_38960 [Angustibacter aerolatus]|uniref:Uncharacterized protein n=1 Tax=Angustibacter aerolatus TaxID=1162965 RepID=A0ABQ6JK53_9ACTN|nr:hypothetical protein GCM10025868_38960 [Angustibacter aerolatus]
MRPSSPAATSLAKHGAGRVQPVAALRVHRLEDLQGGVEPDQVEQRERAHRQTEAEPGRDVEVLARHLALLEHRHRAVQVAEQQRVRDEAGAVAHHHRPLAEPQREVGRGGDRRVVRHDGAHHLDQPLHGSGVEEVQAHDPAGVRGGGGDLGDRQAAGVGGQHRVGAHDVVEAPEHRALQVEPLGHRLDHQVAPRQARRGRPPGAPGRAAPSGRRR